MYAPSPRIVLALLCLLALSSLPLPAPARASLFLPSLGWKDDVDLVVAPDGEFLVVCEAAESGAPAQVSIVDLDPLTGAPVALRLIRAVPGFENGVDPIVVRQLAPGAGYPVLIPVESEGATPVAGVLVLLLDSGGFLISEKRIELGNLGFREDVDGTWSQYLLTAILYFPLETEARDVCGVLAIEVDPRAGMGCAGIGCCTLVSTDGRGGPGIDHSVLADWLPGLAFGVDPACFEIGDANRLVLPVMDRDRDGDLLLVDFDPNDAAFPMFIRHFSVEAVNETSALPTPFPGFEADVDPLLFTGACGAALNRLLVPVEGDDGDADLYLLDVNDGANGATEWKLSEWAGTLGLDILGFETGVDLVPLCGLGGAHPNRIALPLETADESDADLWFLDLATGEILARAENPALNPGLTIEGWEIGIDPLQWRFFELVAPVENAAGKARLLLFTPDGVLEDEHDFAALGGDWTFRESVDPQVATVPDPPFRTLFVPVEKLGAAPVDAAVMMFPAPPSFDGVNLETVNPGTAFGAFEVDVDLGLTDKQSPGGAYVYLPEEDPTGANPPRLRFEPVPGPGGPVLVMAAGQDQAPLADLYFFRASDGGLLAQFGDVRGLESGLDLANGRGPIARGNPPAFSTPAGFDADTDPTVTYFTTSVPSPDDSRSDVDLGIRIQHANPSRLPVVVRLALASEAVVGVDVVDAAGRRVAELAAPRRIGGGEHEIAWDGAGEDGRTPPGVYFLRVRGERGILVSKLLVLR